MAGTVFETDEQNDTFTVKIWQDISGVPYLTPLMICAMIRVINGLLWPYYPLPPAEGLITFTGNLLTVENRTVFVAVDDHSCFVEDEIQMFEEQENLMT